MFRPALSVALLIALPSCASIVSGTTQTVSVDTMPQGATCKLVRDGVNVGMVQTPGTAIVKRGSPEIKADCEKDGYQTASVTKSPGMNGWFVGNIIFGGIIGVIVDAADGAVYSYGDFEAIPL